MKKISKCCICGNDLNDEYGNNPYPVKEEGRCCNECNDKYVIPARLENLPFDDSSNKVVGPDWEAEFRKEQEEHHRDVAIRCEEYEIRMKEQERHFHEKINKLEEDLKFKDDIIKSILNIRS